MLSDKLRRILIARSPYDISHIDCMTEAEGWTWVYANPEPKLLASRPQICFTGFRAAEKAGLAREAEASGLQVVDSVTQSLTYLCFGANAGPSKLQKARQQAVVVLDHASFLHLLDTGELPSTASL
jgi:NAD-dependent DNA ligase